MATNVDINEKIEKLEEEIKKLEEINLKLKTLIEIYNEVLKSLIKLEERNVAKNEYDKLDSCLTDLP
jgi:hypothetical protein